MHENEISQFTESLWTSLLGLDVRRNNNMLHQMPREQTLTAYVQIAGAWDGLVTIKCPSALSRRVAAIMFGIDPENVKPEEMRDAMGELANITGGYIKTMLPGPCQLSLPAVTDNLDARFTAPSNRVLCQVAFECQQQPLLVTLVQYDKSQAGAH